MPTTTPIFDMSKAVPISPAPKPLFDMSKAVPVNGAGSAPGPGTTSPAPGAGMPPAPKGLAYNSKGEGTYSMTDPSGQPVSIPYSNVQPAIQQGHLFADKGSLQQFARDQAADPLSEDRVDQFLDKHPWLAAPIHAVEGFGTGALKLITGPDKLPYYHDELGKWETRAQLAAAAPTKGVSGKVGETGENVAEFFSGEELLSLLGKSEAALGMAGKLKSMTGLAQMLEKYPLLAKVLKVGSTAIKQGTVGAAQTYARTMDPGAAAATAAATLGMGAVLGGVNEGIAGLAGKAVRAMTPEAAVGGKLVEGVELPPAPKSAPTNPAQAQGAKAYTAMAQRAVREPLEGVNRAFDASADAEVPRIDVANAVTRTGDIAAGREVLKSEMSGAYDYFDHLTDGQFRVLNGRVAAADAAAAHGDPEKAGDYIEAVKNLDALVDSTRGKATPEMIQAVKTGFRRYYAMGNISKALDAAMDGLPGQSAVSQEQRGIKGEKLLAGLSNLIHRYGRNGVDHAFGIPGAVDSLEAIGNATRTNAGRKAVNSAVLSTARFMMRRAGGLTGAAVGARMAGAGGAVAGYVGGEGAAITLEKMTGKVYRAILANPKAAQNLIFAIHSGANPENYGPMLATMIQQHETEAARQRQAEAQQSSTGEGSTQ